MSTNYGPVTVTDSVPYIVRCSEHGVLREYKQPARAHSAARKHAVALHGYRAVWTFNVDSDSWVIDAPNSLLGTYWVSIDGTYSWAVLEPASPASASGMLVNGRAVNPTSARVQVTLAIADILGPLWTTKH
jgi:hypothetical protein